MSKILFDTSSMFTAWDNYSPKVFPKLWNWLGVEVREQRIITIRPIYKEMKANPDCYAWLRKNKFRVEEVSNSSTQRILQLAEQLEIPDINRQTKGVGKNDLLLIAAAEKLNCLLVTDEAYQSNPPREKYNYKIPLVCRKLTSNVKTMSFWEWLQSTGKKF